MRVTLNTLLLPTAALAALALPACGGNAETDGGTDGASGDANYETASAEAEPEVEEVEELYYGAENLLDPSLPQVSETAPAVFRAKLETTKGDIVIEVHRDWSPNGADRFYNLVHNGYYDGVRFFRVLSGFMAQFGIHGDPAVSQVWRNMSIDDDPVRQGNERGYVSYAMAGPNTRTTQLFINYGDNSGLDPQGFSAFGQVVEGMDVVDSLYADYGEGAPRGFGPNQGLIQQRGNEYLDADFPKLDSIERAYLIDG